MLTFRNDTQSTFTTDEELRGIPTGTGLPRTLTRLDDLSRGKNDGLRRD